MGCFGREGDCGILFFIILFLILFCGGGFGLDRLGRDCC